MSNFSSIKFDNQIVNSFNTEFRGNIEEKEMGDALLAGMSKIVCQKKKKDGYYELRNSKIRASVRRTSFLQIDPHMYYRKSFWGIDKMLFETNLQKNLISHNFTSSSCGWGIGSVEQVQEGGNTLPCGTSAAIGWQFDFASSWTTLKFLSDQTVMPNLVQGLRHVDEDCNTILFSF